mmetsp:Transcript_14221/g.38965  ORF Transcript_14221/g.38965 Transcript_14221/m.38965 type:complete len:879 (+) Transcript_14221:447-3083(+)
MRRGRVEDAQQHREAVAHRRGLAFGLEAFERVQQLHRTGDDGVVLHALVVVADLLQHVVHLAAQGLAVAVQRGVVGAAGLDRVGVAHAEVPHPFQKAVRALDGGVVPLQRLFGRAREHHEQAGGVGAVLVDQGLRVHAVVLGLGHGRHLVLETRAVLLQRGAGDAAALIVDHVDLVVPVVVLAAALGLVEERALEHHALRQQLLEGLGHVHQLQVAHHLGPEARVQQMQDGVLDAADVLVHAAPAGDGLVGSHPVLRAGADHRVVVGRVAVAHEVPGRIDEGVHRVRLALGRLAALRAAHVQEAGMLVQRVAAAVGDQVLGQRDGQILLGHGHDAAVIAVDDRDGRAPVALAADAPVAQAPGGLLLAQALGRQQFGDLVDRGLVAQAVEHAGVDAHAARLVAVPLGPGVRREALALDGHHLLDLDAVLLRKREVALVVRRHAHHGAVAIAHQHIVADPHRHLGAGDGVRDEQARGHALLVLRGELGLGRAAGLAFLNEGGHLGLALRGDRGQRMLRRHRAEGHAHDGVGAGREHPQLVAAAFDAVRERKAHALALADPVLLHQPHALGPAGEVVRVLGVGHRRQQFLGVLRDLQVVARDLALLDQRARAPAAAVDDLLIGQHGLVHRVPVDDLGAALGNAGLQHLQEQPLVPLVVARLAGRNLAAPVNGQAHGLHLALHVGDVGIGPLRGRHLALHRGVLGRQAEGVPAHRHQDVVALHAQLAGQHVVDRVVAHMAHVQLARGIGQHGAGVEMRLAGVLGDAVGIALGPVGTGGGFDLVGLVAGRFDGGVHGPNSRWRLQHHLSFRVPKRPPARRRRCGSARRPAPSRSARQRGHRARPGRRAAAPRSAGWHGPVRRCAAGRSWRRARHRPGAACRPA